MRKRQQQELLDFVSSLHQAHEEVKGALDNKNYIVVQNMLSECQEFAITLGNTIEKLEGEGQIAVSYIEEYCELLFHTFENISQHLINENKIYKTLKKQLLKIENSIKNDIHIKKEVVFFPYKASMWDSLESVYLAAKEDPNCDAYCVPIPYYDLKPDQSFGQMHYEGSEYPKNIEIVDWQTYSFEERGPDAIYIHNPNDNCNLVTSVPKRFYSVNLKKYTEKLIYIPYFILGEIEPDNQEAIDGMKHFIWTPGVINADKVIVQSEKMKKIYVNEYLKAAKENGLQGNHLDRQYLEQKILGLGSPKIDKVFNTRREDFEIPKDWMKIIEKPDGSWKKIIFYNTSVGALLQHNENMLVKMQYVFDIFKSHQEEVALLWRPHPLIEATVKSMRPQLWLKYDRLVRKYQAEDWGIYDNTSDVDRAIVLSDVYYGDGSSVVNLYNHIGKTAIIQSMNIKKNFIRNMLEWAVEDNDKLYFSAMEFNGICSLDLKNGLMDIETHITEDKRCIFRAYGKGRKKDNKLYLDPLMSNKVVIYDLKNARYDWIVLPKMDQEALNHQKSKQIILHENNIYVLPKTEYYPYIVQINEKSKQVRTHEVIKYCVKLKDDFCNTSTELDDDKFLFCLYGNLFEFFYATGEIKKSEYDVNEKIKDIYVSKNEVIILAYKIFICNFDGTIIDEIEIDNYDILADEKINKIYKKGKKIYLYSNYSIDAKQIYCIDIQTREMKCTDIKEEETYFLSLVENGSDIFFIYFLNDKLHLVYEDLSMSECKINIQFDIDKYILDERDWLQKFKTTYNCLNEAELLIKDIYNL